jgi:alpha-beta hydrolase superfamily lysophospholipase
MMLLVAAVILAAAVLTAGAVWQLGRLRRQFMGRRAELDAMRGSPSDLGLTYEPFEATNPEGTRLAGWWLPGANPAGTVVMIHGFGQNKSSMLSRAAVFVGEGLNVALVDLRARGDSGGERADLGPQVAFDVLAALDALIETRRHTGLPMIGYGFSHGARAVTFAAAHSPNRFAAIIAEAVPFSLREGLKRQTRLPWVPPLPEGDLLSAFAALRERPILLLLGDSDPEVSEPQAASLLAGNTHPASGIVVFAHTGHGVLNDANRAQYRQAVADFRSRIAGRGSV